MTNFSATTASIAATDYQIKWERSYQNMLREFLKTHWFFDGSQLCAWMRASGLGEPVHHNMWATQINYYAGQDWMAKVGRTRFPQGDHSHGRDITEWESMLCLAKNKKVKKVKP